MLPRVSVARCTGTDLLNLETLVAQVADKELPPVKNWHPQHERVINMRIDRGGAWYYEGSRIERQRMVALFSTVLRRDGDQYFLVTPSEKLQIEVEDAPFVALLMDVTGEGGAQQLNFTDNCGNQFVADQQHPVWMAEKSGEELPYVMVRENLPAIIARPVFYHLADLAEDHDGVLGVWSAGQFFNLADPR